MTTSRSSIIISVFFSLLAGPAWAEAPGDWFPGPFGPEDRIGAANHLSPEIVKAAAGLVTHGKAYSLGMEVNGDTPAYPPRTFQMVVTQRSIQ